MNIHEAIDAVLREQNDKTNMIETLWTMYAATMKVPPGGVQWIETRRAFFTGAMALFEAILRILDPGKDPTEADLARMASISKELERFGADLKAHLA